MSPLVLWCRLLKSSGDMWRHERNAEAVGCTPSHTHTHTHHPHIHTYHPLPRPSTLKKKGMGEVGDTIYMGFDFNNQLPLIPGREGERCVRGSRNGSVRSFSVWLNNFPLASLSLPLLTYPDTTHTSSDFKMNSIHVYVLSSVLLQVMLYRSVTMPHPRPLFWLYYLWLPRDISQFVLHLRPSICSQHGEHWQFA